MCEGCWTVEIFFVSSQQGAPWHPFRRCRGWHRFFFFSRVLSLYSAPLVSEYTRALICANFWQDAAKSILALQHQHQQQHQQQQAASAWGTEGRYPGVCVFACMQRVHVCVCVCVCVCIVRVFKKCACAYLRGVWAHAHTHDTHAHRQNTHAHTHNRRPGVGEVWAQGPGAVAQRSGAQQVDIEKKK